MGTVMQRVMAKQAEAERERRAVIIHSAGEVTAAANIAKAAKNLNEYPGALHLRTLQTVSDLSAEKSNTQVYAVPVEFLKMLKGMAK